MDKKIKGKPVQDWDELDFIDSDGKVIPELDPDRIDEPKSRLGNEGLHHSHGSC